MEGKWAATAVMSWLWVLSTAGQNLPEALPATGFVPVERDDRLKMPEKKAAELRRDALARAVVWRSPPTPIEEANLRGGPGLADQVVCKFHPQKTSGATPKFTCVFEGGEVLKVKYGRNPEIHTEVAAARLLEALGAGADHMYLVSKVRCFGCPEDPYAVLSCLSSPLEALRDQCQPRYGEITPNGAFVLKVDYSKYVDFETVSVERPLEGKVIEAGKSRGWGWDELDPKAKSTGPRQAERDALRLLAVFLNNWDNRPDNQRLTCWPGGERADGECTQPFAFMHDLGATFGRLGGKAEWKLDVEGWKAVPIWKDARTCKVSIDSLLLNGATFGEAVISEAGRLFLSERLGRLTQGQVRDLIEGARFTEYRDAKAASQSVDEWVSAFEGKVRQITERPPCPNP